MNKKCIALNEETYKKIISAIRSGFIYNGVKIKPNNRIATALVLEANLGLRISDILALRMEHFIRDGSRYRLEIIEKKTKKIRSFTVPTEIYSYVQEYAYINGIKRTAKLFDISECKW